MVSKDAIDKTPLLAPEIQQDIERGALCRLVERACRAIGIRTGCQVERVAAYVARLGGLNAVRATVTRIVNDKSIDCTAENVRAAIKTLEQVGVLKVEVEPPAPTLRRGRPMKLYRLSINWDHCREVVREFEAYEREMRHEVVAISEPVPHENDFSKWTQNGSQTGSKCEANGSEKRGKSAAPHCSFPINPITHGPQSPPDQSESRTEDQIFVTDRESIEPIAINIARALRWPTSPGDTVWRIAAAFVAGQVTESDIRSSCRGAILGANRDRVGYMRNSLSERLGHGKAGTPDQKTNMKRFLARFACRGGFPARPPSRESAALPGGTSGRPQRPPASERPVDWNERREAVLAACVAAAIESGESGR